MGIGATVRRRFGRYESTLANAYRSYFIRLGDLAELLRSDGSAGRILEIGCGDGSLAAAMTDAFPDADFLGIDIADDPGRLFEGDRTRAVFRNQTAEDLEAAEGAAFDLVLVCDVLHHVPPGDRPGLLQAARALTRPGGRLVIKDWERDRSLAHALTYASDRYVSGDRGVQFFAPGELPDLLGTTLPDCRTEFVGRIPPHRNNLAVVLRRDG